MRPLPTRVVLRYANRQLQRDYQSLLRGEMDLGEFTKQHRVKAVAKLPQGRFSHYDCGAHATLRVSQILGLSEFKWTPGGEIPWSEAKRGDWVQYDGWHFGVVIDPKRKIVESCWGIDGVVIQHPATKAPYKNPKVYRVEVK